MEMRAIAETATGLMIDLDEAKEILEQALSLKIPTEPTAEMIEAFEKASGRSVGKDSLAGLRAVLALLRGDA
jgi:hypothetical protein